jgi:vitamin K-dependent gamma-carboxylase
LIKQAPIVKKGTSAKGGAIEKPLSRSSETRTLANEKNAAEGFPARWNRFQFLLARPVNGASLAAFRIAVGLVMTLEAFSLLRPSASTSGRVMLETYYTGSDIKFHFPYGWFEWLPVLPNAWMHALVWLLGLASIFLAVGFCYRGAAALVFLAWGYFYAVESTRTYWMSYYYLELLVTFLLIWMPAARRYSIDACLFKRQPPPATVPYWTLVLLRSQLVIAYFYAGLAKINADWLLDAVPVRNFLARSSFLKVCESYFSVSQIHSVEKLFNSSELAYFLSWTGAMFDLSVGFLLLFRRTRMIGFVLLVLFHMTNHFILFDDIIWFPLLGILTATIFFDPNWPERFWQRITSAKPKATNEPEGGFYKLGRFTAVFVSVWLACQVLIPLRHYLIRGDGRFTWEGISFSWRLKTEIYSSSPCEITIKDKGIASQDTTGKIKLDLNQWHGDKVLYRQITPGRIDWTRLPEVVALSEPEIGERIIYNPFSNSNKPRNEAESRERAERIWKELYGRAPTTIHKTIPLSEIVDGYITAMKKKGGTVFNSRDEALAALLKVHGRGGNGQMIPFLRRMHPFAALHDTPISGPFLVIEDGPLFASATGLPHLQTAGWKSSAYTLPSEDRYLYSGGEPLIIHIAEIGLEQKRALPQMFIFDSLENPDEGPEISWDYLRELSVSQGMHISTQPFLLRRYARRVADLWEHEYGRRPEVHASTAVSLNGRPHQALVDPKADLASVSASHFRHNSWIEDLQMRRIPPALH